MPVEEGPEPDSTRAGPPGQPSGAASISGLFGVFFVIGLTAFGMAILQAIRSVPVKRGWLRLEDIDEGLGLVQMYPGAVMVDLVTYVGYRVRGIRGALAAVAGFITPSLLLVLGLSWAYAVYGAAPGVGGLVIGLDAIVVAVVASVTLDFAAEHARGKLEAVLAVGAFAVAVAGVNLLWAVAGALAVGAVCCGLRPSQSGGRRPPPQPFPAGGWPCLWCRTPWWPPRRSAQR